MANKSRASIFTGCIPVSIEDSNHKATALAYESKNPVADSDAAFGRADYRIYTALGFARYTDVLESEGHANAVHAAVGYAKAYNLHLLDRLRSGKLVRF